MKFDRRIRLRVSGDFACFTRPEFKAERRSYEAMTPSAAEGILTAVYWKPEMQYRVRRIFVEKPIQFTTMKLNEVTRSRSVQQPQIASDNRVQCMMTALFDVSYVIEADIYGDLPNKHGTIFLRRATRKQSFRVPSLGMREFIAKFEYVESDAVIESIPVDLDIGPMLRERVWDDDGIGIVKDMKFFNAVMKNGVINVPSVA